MGAKESVHIVSEGTATTTARAKLALRAGDGITAFADDGALKLIAANDEVRCESQASSLELIAKKVLEIISADDWVNIRAKKGIRLNVNGSELVLTEEGIRGYTGGTCEFHAAEHKTCGAQRRPLDLGVTAIPAVATLLDENQWVEIHLHDQGGNPLAGQRFVLTDPAGAQHTGVLDEHGCARVEPVKPGLCTVQFPDLDVSTSVQS